MLKLTLDECGYTWRTIAKPDPKILTRRSVTHFEQPRPTPDPSNPTQSVPCPTGRPETVTFRYEGMKAGSTTLRLGYFAPGRDRKQAGTFRLTVRVR